MRVWMRYGIFVSVFNCAGAGISVSWILSKVKEKWKVLLGFLLLFVVLVDFFNDPFAITEVKPREVDLWLAKQPSGGLVQFPFDKSLPEEVILYTLFHHKPVLSTTPTFPSDRFIKLGSSLRSFPDEKSIRTLQDEKILILL